MSIQEARETIRQAFEDDPDFRRGYRDNIAMLLHDHHGITGKEERDSAADDIIRLVFGQPMNRDWNYNQRMSILLQAFGEASALFMSQDIPGTNIVMPAKELIDIAERTDKLIQSLTN